MGGNTIDIGAVVDAALQAYDREHNQVAPADPGADLLATMPAPTPAPVHPIVARVTRAPDSGVTPQPPNLFSPIDDIIARGQAMGRGGVGQPGTTPNLASLEAATVRFQGQTLTFSANFGNRRPAGAVPLANAGGPVRTPVDVVGPPPDEPAVPVEPIATRSIYVGGTRDAQSLAQAYFRANPDALQQIREHLTHSPVH